MPSIFADQADEHFARYHVALQFRNKLMAGIPGDPKLIEGWLRGKAGIDDAVEIRQALLRTMQELDPDLDLPADASFEDVVKASEKYAGVKQTCRFKRDENGLYIEGRQVKAAIKESVNILFAGDRWGRTKKGPQSYTAERVFTEPNDAIYLGREEPDGVELVIGHVTGPQGKRSTLGYHEYAVEPRIEFDLLVTDDGGPDALTPEQWVRVWIQAEHLGIGALRSQGYGTFDVEVWEHVKGTVKNDRKGKKDAAAAV